MTIVCARSGANHEKGKVVTVNKAKADKLIRERNWRKFRTTNVEEEQKNEKNNNRRNN